jgi:hypothetical protein
MTDPMESWGPSDHPSRSDDDEPSEQTAGAGGNNPARKSETGGNSIEVGDDIQNIVELDPGDPA